MENKTITFNYNIFSSDTLEKQANSQGHTLGDKSKWLEDVRKSINQCIVVTTSSQQDMMFKKLNKIVMSNLKMMSD